MLYNYSPSNVIVNAVCNIGNSPLLKAADTGRCLCNVFYAEVDRCFNMKIMLTCLQTKLFSRLF